MKRIDLFFCFVLILLFLVLHLPYLLELTPVWPDEAVFADVALNMLQTGVPSTQLWQGLMPRVEYHAFWYPPVFIYLLALWFKVFGFSIVIQRYLSIFLTCLFICIFYFFVKKIVNKEITKTSFFKTHVLAFLTTVFLILDPIFLRSSTINRPEMLVLILITIATVLLVKSTDLKLNTSLKKILLTLSGFLIGFSILTHFLSGLFLIAFILYLLMTYRKKFFTSSFSYFFIFSALVPLLGWLLSILPDINILKTQLDVVSQGRDLIPNYLEIAFFKSPLTIKIGFLIYALTTIIVLAVYLYSKANHFLILFLLSVTSWLLAFFGKINWYSVYIIPFCYISLVLLLIYSFKFKKNSLIKDLKYLVILFLVILSFSSLKSYVDISSALTNHSYLKFINRLESSIPPRKTIFLSSIPETYYAFKANDSFKLYEFPMAKTDPNDFKDLLKELDYVVINAPLSNAFIKDELDKYLEEKMLKTLTINESGYSVSVIELKK